MAKVKPGNKKAAARPRVGAKSARMRAKDNASKARDRMGRRARRQRFFKENKQRIMYGFLGFLLILYLAFFTPWGPAYYYNKMQERKWEKAGVLETGYITDLYKLGRFYAITFRSDDAQKCYDEIGMLKYGFTFSEYGADPGVAEEKRVKNLKQIEMGEIQGPPYIIPQSDACAVAFAIRETADKYWADNRRTFAKYLVVTLFQRDFLNEYPHACDRKFVDFMEKYAQRLERR